MSSGFIYPLLSCQRLLIRIEFWRRLLPSHLDRACERECNGEMDEMGRWWRLIGEFDEVSYARVGAKVGRDNSSQ